MGGFSISIRQSFHTFIHQGPGLIAQSVAQSDSRANSPRFYTWSDHVLFSTDSRRALVSYWQKYVHLVLVNCLGSLNLPKNSVVRLTDCHDHSCLPCNKATKPSIRVTELIITLEMDLFPVLFQENISMKFLSINC